MSDSDDNIKVPHIIIRILGVASILGFSFLIYYFSVVLRLEPGLSLTLGFLAIFGVCLGIILIERRRVMKEDQETARFLPNTFVCPNCNTYKQIYYSPREITTQYCTNCGSKMNTKHVDELPDVKVLRQGKCWIATAVYGDPFQPEINILRDFRDGILDASPLGYRFTRFYYKTSPCIANVVEKSTKLRNILRILLIQPAVKISILILINKQIEYFQNLDTIRNILRRRYRKRHLNMYF